MWGFYRFLIVCPESRRVHAVHDDMIIWQYGMHATVQRLKDGVRFRQCDGRSGIVCTGRSGFHRAKRCAQVQVMQCCRIYEKATWCLGILRLTATWQRHILSFSCHFWWWQYGNIMQYYAIFCLSSGFHGLDGLDGRLTKVASPPVLSRSAESRQDSTRLPTNQCCHHVTGC